MMATSAIGRESRLLAGGGGMGGILLHLHVFGWDIKAKKNRGVPQVTESSTPLNLKKEKKKRKTIPYISPDTDGLPQESVQSHEANPTSSAMDHPLMLINRFPRS